MAPQSQIHLIQVLDENAQGDLYTLNEALDAFIRERLNEHVKTDNEGQLTNTIINLSLGFPQPQRLQDYNLSELDTLVDNLMRELELRPEEPVASPLHDEPDKSPVVSLETLVVAAHRLGALVVAAAGNESETGKAQKAHAPAAYRPYVIGVKASNSKGKRACYSNEGEVAAPGGDSVTSNGKCSNKLDEFEYHYFCNEGSISLALRTSPESGYACWVGTSFSAPLVSGQAALYMANGNGRDETTQLIKNSYYETGVVSLP
jgi:hypothetical protein